MLVRVSAFLLLAAGSAWSQPGGGRRGPPASAYAACDGAAEDADCSFTTPRGRSPGYCYYFGDRLACVPPDAPRPPARERPEQLPPPPEEAEPAPEPARRSARRAYVDPRLAAPAPAPAAPAPLPALAPAAPAAEAPDARRVEIAPPPSALAPIPPLVSAAAPAAAAPAAPEPPRTFPYGALLGLLGCLAGAAALWRSSSSPATAPAPPPEPAAPVVSAPPVVYTPPADTEALLPPRPAPAPPPAPAPVPAAATVVGQGASAIGRVVGGDYVIRREIGAGGMGVVYEAMDLKLDRRVALKKMRQEISQSARGRERFLSEARLVAKLQHPNIVTIHGIIEEGPDLYLVFEYVDGETLDDLLGRNTRLTSDQALAVLKGVSEAVDHAHEHKVIHRDLKPANIMIDKSGHVKVMDFGIAHQAKITVSQFTVAEAFGTMAYMPPEQELGKAVRESDVYAFAALTYESLTGALPFPGPNFHLQKEAMSFTRPSGGVPPLSARLDPVFERAFQVEPKKRYPTTGEFVRTLQGALVAA